MPPELFIVMDRDGVVNEDSDDYIRCASDWVPISGSMDAIAKLTQSGFRVAVVTNQSGLARGLFDIAALNGIHNKFRDHLALSGGRVEMILFCPHSPTDECNCRKPRLGLFIQLAQRIGFPLNGIPYIGDSITDIEVARSAGMTPMLVMSGKGQKTLGIHGKILDGIRVFQDLREVAEVLVSRREVL